MASILAYAGGALSALAAAPHLVGAGPADPRQDLGAHWGLAVSLCVVNAAVVVYYLIRIWTAKDAPAA